MVNRLRTIRKNKGLTLEEVGKGVGLATNTISRYEKGKREPKLAIWKKLAEFYGVSVSYLQGVDLNLDDMLKKIIPELHKEYFDNYLLLKGELPKDNFTVNPKVTTTLNRLIAMKGEKKKPISFYSKEDKKFVLSPEIKKYWFNLLLPFVKDMYNDGWLIDTYISIDFLINFIASMVTRQEAIKNKMNILESYMSQLHYFDFDDPLHHLMNTSIRYSNFETAKENFGKYFSFLEEVRDKVFSKSKTEILKEVFDRRLRMEEREGDKKIIKKIKSQVDKGDTELARFLVESDNNWDDAYKEYDANN